MNPSQQKLIDSLPDMLRPFVLPATMTHVDYLAPRLRNEDKLELRACAAHSVATALLESFSNSAMAWMMLHPAGKRPQAMAGLVMRSDGSGVPWAVSAPFDKPALRLFLAAAPLVVDYMLKQVTYLVNLVDARNHKALRWLAWTGFSLGEKLPCGVENLEFIKFSMWGEKLCAV